MSLYGLYHLVQPTLPDHCEPTNAVLYHLSSTFHTCVPTNLALASTCLGSMSILAWLFAQLPQIWKNYKLHSTSGLSIFFLAEWLLGDMSNLFGSVFTHQALWQVIIASYYCFVDCLLVSQYIWYEYLKHGRPLRSVWWSKSRENSQDPDTMSIYSQTTDAASISSKSSKPIDTPQVQHLRAPEIRGMFRTPRFSASPSSPSSSSLGSTPTTRNINRITAGTSPAPSPRTIIYISLLLAIAAQASPLHAKPGKHQPSALESPTEMAGRILSWLSTVLYLGSRVPQLYKNYSRRSTSGLSPTLFIAAFFGNLFYSTSIFTNPCAWYDFGPYGGRGWAGPNGSNRAEWVGRALPFFLGAAGVLFMDFMMGLQFLYFGEAEAPRPTVVVVELGQGKKWRWRRVSGYMRGWMPSVSVAGTPRPSTPASRVNSAIETESERLLGHPREEPGYGGV
jgi:uncharacterized protein with PQ loop repeat